MSSGGILAEPLYIILAALGHPDAHEKVRLLAIQSRGEKRPILEIMGGDSEMRIYLERMTPHQKEILSNPALYTGIAAGKAQAVAARWQERLKL